MPNTYWQFCGLIHYFFKEMKKVISVTIIPFNRLCFPANAQIKTVSGENISSGKMGLKN